MEKIIQFKEYVSSDIPILTAKMSNKYSQEEFQLWKSYYLSEDIVNEQEQRLEELVKTLKERQLKDESLLNDIERWVIDNALNEYRDFIEYTDIIDYTNKRAAYWIPEVLKIGDQIQERKIFIPSQGIKFLLITNIRVLLYATSCLLESNITFDDLKKHIPTELNYMDLETIDKLKVFYNKSYSEFYEDDLNVRDIHGNKIPPNAKLLEKNAAKNARGETNSAFIVKQTLRAFFPTIEGGIQILNTTTGLNPYGILSNSPVFDTKPQNPFSFKDFDNNIILNLLPNLLMGIAYRTNNRIFRLSASASPLILQLITNFKERQNPLCFNKDEEAINWAQLGSLLIPFLVEGIRMLFPKDQFDHFIHSKETPIFNDMNQQFLQWQQKQIAESQKNQNLKQPSYMNMRREIKQPR